MKPSLEELVGRIIDKLAVAPDGTRMIIGITGSPGAGKTTLAGRLIERLAIYLSLDHVANVPMDGYHLADVTLQHLGLRERKGAPATFDADGYVALLRRIRANTEAVIYAPGFDRIIEQPIAGSIAVPRRARVIVTEGNYLLMDGPWTGARAVLDEVWFCRPEENLRVERLLSRHVQFGKTWEAAVTWMAENDAPNAQAVAATADRADLIIEMD